MKEKTRKIFIMIVMAALIVSLMAASFAALTYGRYAGGRRDENSPYDDFIDFVGATAFTVQTPEELTNAIENGYSYIKIAADADAEEPFVVNNNIANVYTNLVIDVNGNTVIRNSRNPLLDVKRSVSVVLVYDSSKDAAGGFYNPVGSALQTSGGTLTVGAGVYESGPKIASVSSVTAENITDVFVRDGERDLATSYERASSAAHLPKLTKDVYLENNVTEGYLRNDTYLLYTVEKNGYVDGGQLYVNAKKDVNGTVTSADKFSPICDVASCDFYYYYPVDDAANEDEPQTYAVVYGYNDVNSLAKTEDTGLTEYQGGTQLVWPYAAIRSVEDPETQEGGVTHARGGVFKTHFGTDNTYGILSVGGEMTVGTESATAPPTFTAVGEGTCIGMSAGENDTLTIASGTFTSEVGDTILMRGGEMTVTGGTFTKSGNKARPSGGLEAIEASRTALIHMLGGELTIDGTVTDKKYSVTMVAGSEQTPLTNVFGIYSAEDDTSGRATAGTVSVSGCSIAVHGTYSAGVLSSAGTVNLGGTAEGKAETNITVNNSISNNLLTSSAVSSEGGTIKLNNTVNITSDSLGITARGTVNVEGGTTTVNTSNATGVYVNSGTLTVKNNATLTVDSAISNASYSWVTPPGTSEPTNAPNIYNGVYVQNGSLNSNGTLNVTFKGVENDKSGDYLTQQIKSYAVRVEGAGTDTKVTIASGTILNGAQSDLTRDEEGNITGISGHSGVGGGVLVNGGTVTLGKQETTNGVTTYSGPTVQTTGNLLYATVVTQGGWWPNYNYTWNWSYVVDSSWQYMLNKSGGHAVEVSGGSLTVHGGNYTAQQGNGILIRNTSENQTTNNVEINQGTFKGFNSGYYVAYGYGQTPLSGNRMVGPAASYGLNVMGHHLDVTINDGTFGEAGNTGNSAASFFGTPVEGTSDEIKESRPEVAVHGGTFNANNADAISVFRFIDITFDGTVSQISSNISDGDVASLSVQNDLLYTGVLERGSTITIQSGTFTGTAYGIWYACGYDKLNITGGTIRGTGNNKNGHALNIDVEPKTHAIHIGGTAKLFGGRDAIYVNNAGGDKNAVSITGGTFTGAEKDTAGSGDYGCAIWFNSGMDDSVYQITGGTFITKKGGSAIWTSNPDGHFLWQIFPDGCSITDGEGNSFNRFFSFDTAINGISEITVSRS